MKALNIICILSLSVFISCVHPDYKGTNKSRTIIHKIKPKYELGDIVFNKLDYTKYLIICVPEDNAHKYKIKDKDGYYYFVYEYELTNK